MDIDLRAVVDRLIMVVDVRIPTGLVRDVPEWFVERRALERAKWRLALGCEVATLAEARRDWWPRVDAYHHLAGSMLAMLTPDGRIGLATDQDHAIPPGDRERAVVDEMLLAVIQGSRGETPRQVAPLPRMLRDVLVGDGLSPDGFRAIGACINDIDIRIGGLRRRAKLGMKRREHLEALDQGLIAHGTPLSDDILAWHDEDIQLSRKPSIHAANGRVSADIELPHAVLQALPGRAATDAIDHPALAGRIITKAAPRKRGFTIHLDEDAAA
jgi:hypothetical protein